MSETVREVVIDHLDRLTNTKDGNPRYRVHLSTGETLHTEPDSQAGYFISNYTGLSVQLTLNATGRVVKVEGN